jgi:hypothetical protein
MGYTQKTQRSCSCSHTVHRYRTEHLETRDKYAQKQKLDELSVALLTWSVWCSRDSTKNIILREGRGEIHG